jgi:hypothetical protein
MLNEKINYLGETLQIVEKQVEMEAVQLASKDLKMGAKANQVSEHEEWLLYQA